jgi:hypothetical protein
MKPYRLLAWAISIGLLVLVLVRLAASAVGQPISDFTRDTVAVAGLPWYTGSVSLLTCMVWAAAAALSLFVAWAAPETRRRTLSLGAFTVLLAIDDSMQIHDQIGPGHGIPEKLFAPIYAVAALLLLREMLRGSTRATITAFLVGAGLLAVSVMFDVVFHDVSFLVEDGAKFLGALVWVTVPVLAYAESTTNRRLSPSTAPAHHVH